MLSAGVTNQANLRLRKAAYAQAPSQFATSGGQSYGNEFTIDGAPNTVSTGNTPRVAFNPPQASVGEFRVQTNHYDGSIGRTSGAVVNVSTTAGTNRLRGGAHHWFRNAALDAPDFFQNKFGNTKPIYQDNRFGFSLGGPVWVPKVYNGRNKSFFFYAYERNIWGTAGNTVGTVPRLNHRQGDLSDLLALGANYQIYDPLTARLDGARIRRDPLPGNIVPANRISPVAKNLMQFWPEPNAAGTADGRNNYGTPTKTKEDYFVHLARLDHSFSQNHQLFARLNYDWWEIDRDNPLRNVAGQIFNDRVSRGLALDDVIVVSPTTVLNLRYGVAQSDFSERKGSRGMDIAALGFSPALTRLLDPRTTTLPTIQGGNYLALSRANAGDGKTSGMVHSFSGTVNRIVRSHHMKMGGEFRVNREFSVAAQFDNSPNLLFGTTYTRGPLDTTAAAPMGQDLATLLLGIPTGGELRRSASRAEQDLFTAFFFHDDWKATSRLTLNLSIRYELESPVTERFDRSVKGFAFGVPNPIEQQARANYALNPIDQVSLDRFRVLGGLMFAGGANGRALWRSEKNNFLPRIGFAYQIDKPTVLSGGYGWFYDTLGISRSNVSQAGFTQSTPLTPTLDSGLTFISSIANPFPNGVQKPLGAAGGLTTNLGQAASFFAPQRLNPLTQRWNLALQRLLPQNLVVKAAYVGTKETRREIDRPLNFTPEQYMSKSPERDQATIDFLGAIVQNPFFGLIPTAGRTTTRAVLLREYRHFSSAGYDQPIGYTWYHALQLTADRRFASGFTGQMSYTFSKMMEAISLQNPTDAMPLEVISSMDRPHRLAMSGIWELPFGRGRKLWPGAPGWANHIVGGWQLNMVAQRQAGAPINFGNVIFRGNIKDIPLPKGQRSVERWFNTDAGFERNSARQLAQNIVRFPPRFAGIRGDGQARWDFSLLKTFPIKESVKLEYRAECYNAWNHANLNAPNATPTSSAFGTISSVGPTPRQFQMALKLTF